jgi:hypothetical protein
MVHRIELSTALLIAVKKQKTGTSIFQPQVTGIKISARPANIFEKGTRAVNELGNIVPHNSKKEVAA